MKENMTRRNRTKIMPRKVGLAVPANVKLKLPNVRNLNFIEVFADKSVIATKKQNKLQ
jgi:hypothetical protein